MSDNFRQSDIFNQEKKFSRVKKDKGLTVYRASAGAGKTYTLTKEYLKQALASDNANAFRGLLAVTFTNKATEEMKSRIVGMLNGIATGDEAAAAMAADLLSETGIDLPALRTRAENVRSAILHDYSRFSVSTIDKFFQKVLHAFVREAGLRPGFKLELDKSRLLNEAVDRLVLSLHDKVFLHRWLFGLIDERMERGAAWDLRGVLKEKGEAVFNEKFRSFDYYFHEKIGDAEFMTAYRRKLEEITRTFESEMKNIGKQALATIESKNIEKSDFSGGERGPVNYFSKICKGDFAPGKRTLSVKKWYKEKIPDTTIQAIESISGTLDALLQKALDLYERDYRAYSTALCVLKDVKTLSFLSEIESNVRTVASDENSMPISETVHLLEKLVGDSETPFIYERIGNRYGSFMIDEFQDTSDGQWRNLKPLMDNSLSENKFSMVVGDVKQSIYRWRNGDWGILTDIENDFRKFGVTEKKLGTNYRSDGSIIEFNNYVFDRLPVWVENEFNLGAENEYSTDMPSKAYDDSGQKMREDKRGKGYVCVSCVFDDDENKSDEKIATDLPSLVAEIQDRGYRAGDIAVLVRQSADGRKVGDCLMEYKRTSGDAKHNFNIVSHDSLCVERSESVRLIVALLRATVDPDDRVNTVFINRTLKKKSTETDLEFLSEEIKSVLNNLTSLSLPEIFEELVAKFDLGADADEISFIQEFHDELVRFSYEKLSDISTFLEYWDNGGGRDLKLSTDKAPDAIRIITIHKAKGLEFPVVIIPYCDWGMKPRPRSTVWVKPKIAPFDELPQVPVEYVKDMKNSYFSEEYFHETAQSLVDNLNLMYVAFTRACEELYVMLPLPKNARNEGRETDKIKTAATTLFEFFKCEKKWDDENFRYVSGEKHRVERKTTAATEHEITMRNYPASNFKKRLKIKYESDDYFSESSSSLYLRNYGNLMHRVFALIKTTDDVPRAVAALVDEGIIDKSEAAELTGRIDKALSNIRASDWFASERGLETERFLLLPSTMRSGSSRRPDRVIARPNETLVIDYKFGQTEKNSHKRQVKEYMNLLSDMDYPDVKGYVWYVDIDKVTEID